MRTADITYVDGTFLDVTNTYLYYFNTPLEMLDSVSVYDVAAEILLIVPKGCNDFSEVQDLISPQNSSGVSYSWQSLHATEKEIGRLLSKVDIDWRK